MINLNNIWLDQESISGKNVIKVRIESIEKLNCFIGCIGATGARFFQLELNAITSVCKNYLKKFRGVEIQAIPSSQSQIEYTIILLEQELTDIFTMFIEDIIEKISTVSETEQALSIINQRVNYWKKLFSRATGEQLSIEKRRGLFGELFFLKLLLENSANHKDAIKSWRGSESENQDFTKHKNAVEIKTTKANNPSLHISNEQQLDFTTWDNLFLGVISITESTGHQNSLTGIIEEINNMISHDLDLSCDFFNRLELAGISNEMISYYNDISYSVNKIRFFRIQEGFPIISRGNLNNESIYNVKYQIDISSCNSFEVSEHNVLKTII